MPFDLKDKVLDDVVSIVIRAGELVVEGQEDLKVVANEGSLHPTTDLDRKVDRFLFDNLPNVFPDPSMVAYFTEERVDDPARLEKEWVLIVDPIDGTRSLLHGQKEAVVSVAIVKGNTLVFGVIVNPFTGERFVAELGKGSFLGNQRLRVSKIDQVKKANLVLSRTECERGLWRFLEGRVMFRAVGSIAYKMVLIASGKAEGTVTVNKRHQWDVAGATLIITEAQGMVSDSFGHPLVFNQASPEFPGIIASNRVLHDSFLDIAVEARRFQGV
jgi:myo-inositol-1(or 4)-monophosphatase